ncbi:zinc ribbon domain-containing protein [Blastopirellula marina]|uniref:Uncharacterized protein n=1 Tax=Blastopirellula marina TaxID=124 RepID=A0A2S8GPU4_9BACT|nr:zinc ribbon domain-containing protein [Blastopirellula marina]PQO46024.1 hypothetical protein C5Y93_10595 [Blastopirellula marina]
MQCPACKNKIPEIQCRCSKCNYGVRPLPAPNKQTPQYIGDAGNESFDHRLGRTYRCNSCRSHGGKIKRISASGAGPSRMPNSQYHTFIVVSCLYCGLIQQFDPWILSEESGGWKNLDFLSDL